MADRTVFIDRASLTVGADPEFFLKRNGAFVSGDKVPCGTKTNPRRTAHGYVQNDGTALELNIPPVKTREEFLNAMRNCTLDLVTIVHEWDREAMVVAEPVADFGAAFAYIEKSALQLGCNPDFNAYSLEMNPTPDGDRPFRTGAGHIHVGWSENQEGLEHMEKCARLVKQLDYTIGLRTLLWDTDDKRRQLYGKAGAFRPKPYGVEYRVPSNKWCSEEKLAGAVFNGVILAVDLLNKGTDFDATCEGLAREIIDNGDREWHKKYPLLADAIMELPF